MSANEKAEAFLIVVKRLLKWAALALLAAAGLIGALYGYERYQESQRNKPYLLTSYAEVKLGDSAEQVRYALGHPPTFLYKGDETKTGNPFDQFLEVVKSDDLSKAHLLKESKVWQYPGRTNTEISVTFDKPGGVVDSIACYSQGSYSCPSVFGIEDGTSEDAVLEHLGKPDAEKLDQAAKVMRYNRYNLTLYLVKKQVYMLEVTAPAPTPKS
jgi:hypothetical protein